MASTKQATTTIGTLPGECGCGCKTATKSTFAPGHDARMVSKAVAATLAGETYLGVDFDTDKVADAQATISKAFSPALGAKYRNTVKRAIDKASRKAVKADERLARSGAAEYSKGRPVKIGRWEYPSRVRISDGRVERNTKRDGSGDWVEYGGEV